MAAPSGPLRRIDLNADVGEGFGVYPLGCDAEILGLVTSANIACGFHAGDPTVMDRTVAEAVRLGVAIGAHPGYPDLRGFGRRKLDADPEEVEGDVLYQIGALQAFARAHRSTVSHVKPHGALYNQAATDPKLARAIARAVARADPELVLVGLATSEAFREAAVLFGLRFAAEAFADRAYEPDGTLASRKRPGALITDPDAAAAQAVRIAGEGAVMATDGSRVELSADTLCLHGDNPSALANARAVRAALQDAGIALRPVLD
jgi:UPF0271 protein